MILVCREWIYNNIIHLTQNADVFLSTFTIVQLKYRIILIT